MSAPLGSLITASNGKGSKVGLKELRFYLPQKMLCLPFFLMGNSASVALLFTDSHSAIIVVNTHSSFLSHCQKSKEEVLGRSGSRILNFADGAILG